MENKIKTNADLLSKYFLKEITTFILASLAVYFILRDFTNGVFIAILFFLGLFLSQFIFGKYNVFKFLRDLLLGIIAAFSRLYLALRLKIN